MLIKIKYKASITMIRSVKNDPETIAAGNNKKKPENTLMELNFIIR
jgi:hypothetical protein|tara:strand:- start:3723 stop:3860 length:138 start_codon:yes stop_codon:yes gene_type:complete